MYISQLEGGPLPCVAGVPKDCCASRDAPRGCRTGRCAASATCCLGLSAAATAHILSATPQLNRTHIQSTLPLLLRHGCHSGSERMVTVTCRLGGGGGSGRIMLEVVQNLLCQLLVAPQDVLDLQAPASTRSQLIPNL